MNAHGQNQNSYCPVGENPTCEKVSCHPLTELRTHGNARGGGTGRSAVWLVGAHASHLPMVQRSSFTRRPMSIFKYQITDITENTIICYNCYR